jgi:predicted AlkP superfamily pyrophosphatase or phosphodiesterase
MKNLLKLLAILCVIVSPIVTKAEQAAKTINDLKPTVILISIDGFKNNFLTQFPVPHLESLAKEGVHSPLLSVFPSVTFPNHYSIVTGLYPEHHGIMLNEFFAMDIKEPFTHHGHAPFVTDPRWWKGEPIGVTAQKQGQRTASAFWPSSQFAIEGVKPTYFRAFAEDGNPKQRVQQILQWLDLPEAKRPTLLLLYFENVDNAGHNAGPDSAPERQAAIQVDKSIGDLLLGLKKRGIASSVDIVLVSDHGMSQVDPKKVIDLMKFIPKNDLITIANEGAIVGVYPKPGRLDAVYQVLKDAKAPMSVYRGSDLSPELHYQYPGRTPPIICVADEQAFILGRDRVLQNGTHGYDPQIESMQGIFIAEGPAFKVDYSRAAFQNINIYVLLTKLLGLTPAKNDGSIEAIRDILK